MRRKAAPPPLVQLVFEEPNGCICCRLAVDECGYKCCVGVYPHKILQRRCATRVGWIEVWCPLKKVRVLKEDKQLKT
jgi:hypothetical protein